MDTIRKQVPIGEIPESWRDGLGDADMVSVTLTPVENCSADISFEEKKAKALASVGAWEDRDDLDDLFRTMRENRHAKFDTLLRDD